MNFVPNPPIHDSRRPKTRPEGRTRNFSLNNAPPAYEGGSESEGEPPKYEESVCEEGGARAKPKKGRWGSIFASFLTVMIVTLVIAVVVGKIYFMKEDEKNETKSDASSTTTTMTSTSTASTTESAVSPQQTTTLHTVTVSSSTASTQVVARATLTLTAGLNVDDAIKARQVAGVRTTTTLDCGPVSQESEAPLKTTDYLGMTTYAHEDCLLEQASFRRGDDDALQYRCSVSCGHGEEDQDVAGAIVVNEWEWDSG